MNNKTNYTQDNNEIVPANNHIIVQNPNNQSLDEKHRDQFTSLAMDAGRDVISSIKENAVDYEIISEDKSLSSVDRALGKRKILAADIGLGTLGICSVLGLAFIAKKAFSA